MNDSCRTVRVAAASRLHFGMLSFGRPGVRQFGGAGVMIDRPGLELRISPSAKLSAVGPHQRRAMEFAQKFLSHFPETPRTCRIEVLSAPPEHAGLGLGTQLGLAVARGLQAAWNLPVCERHALAKLVGRGRRSAVGVHGFALGGLLVESGKLVEDETSPLIARVELPREWRFVLLRPPSEVGLSGEAECDAFEKLPPVPSSTTDQLSRLLLELLPAADCGDFAAFGESLYRYGNLAGICFAAGQHGAYATARLAELVEKTRALGIPGVGQSSWGPTLFALCESQEQAAEYIQQLAETDPDLEFTTAKVANQGAQVQVEDA